MNMVKYTKVTNSWLVNNEKIVQETGSLHYLLKADVIWKGYQTAKCYVRVHFLNEELHVMNIH